MSTTTAPVGALTTASSLLATAALVDATGTAQVSVTVSDADIDIQIPVGTGDEPARAAVVAAYAHVLSTPVRRRRGGPHIWIETHGVTAGIPVHVWTVADPESQPVVA